MSDAYPGAIVGGVLSYVSATSVSIGTGHARSPDDVTDLIIDSNITVDITTSGADGLASNYTESANQLYDVWLITKADGEDPAGLLTESGDALSGVTFPADYIKAQSIYLGTIANIAGGSSDDIQPFIVGGVTKQRIMFYDGNIQSKTGPLAILVDGTATSWAYIPITIIPDNSEAVLVFVQWEVSGVVDLTLSIRHSTDLRRLYESIAAAVGRQSKKSFADEWALYGAPSTDIEYQWSGAPSVGLTVSVRGYRYSVGGE